MNNTQKITELFYSLTIAEQVHYIEDLVYRIIDECGNDEDAWQNAKDLFESLKDTQNYKWDLNNILKYRIEKQAKIIEDNDYIHTRLQNVDSHEYGCFSVREINALYRGIGNATDNWNWNEYTLADLLEFTIEDLMKIRNLGKKSLAHILNMVHDLGYKFKGE